MNKQKNFLPVLCNPSGVFILLLLLPLLFGCTTFSRPPEGIPDFNPDEWDKKQSITLSARGWNWFFRTAPEVTERALMAAAREKAEELYGPEAKIALESRVDTWNSRSLLMLLNSLGWVQDSFITAAVWVPRPLPPPPLAEPDPPPEPEEPRIRRIIRKDYRVVPAVEYSLPSEFTNVDYRPADSIHSILKLKLDLGEIDQEEWEERDARVPAGGRILIQLGRTDLENAISKRFRYTLFAGETRLFRRRGPEDIPYVPGSDKLWWNDVSLDIRQEWDSPLTFTLEDDYQDKIYEYQIIREEWIEEIEF